MITDPLFPDRQPCGCPRGEGHRCDPGFVMVPCVQCGTERPIHARLPSQIRHAEQRPCKACTVAASRRNLTSDSQDEVDEVAVQRLIAGQRPAFTTRAERQQAVQYLLQKRLTNRTIAERLHISLRTVERLRARCVA